MANVAARATLALPPALADTSARITTTTTVSAFLTKRLRVGEYG